VNTHRDLLLTIQYLNRQGLSCLLEFAAIIATAPIYRRAVADEPTVRDFTIVPRTDAHPPLTVQPAHDYYFLTNRRIEVTYATPLLVEWLQTTLDVIKAGWEPFIDGEDELKRVLELWMIAAQTHAPFNYTVRCRTAQGRVAHAFIRVHPWFTSANEMAGFVGTVHAQCIPARVLTDLRANGSAS
jgi:hypothetical protein